MAKLYFYYGTMGSAKTTLLLTTNFSYKERGKSTLVLSPSIDSRRESGKVVSRVGISAHCEDFNKIDNLYSIVSMANPDVVLIDEAQFLEPEQVEQLCKVVDELYINVLAYGLKTDFKSETFPGSKRLLELADTIHEIKTICECGNKAIINARFVGGKIIKDGPQVLIGDTNKGEVSYEAKCRKCWGF